MPRAGLTRQAVISEAAALADRIGYDALTLTALADRVGVAVPSLYKHVGGLEDLRRGVAVLAIRELGAALAEGRSSAATLRQPGRTPLRAMADAYRSFAREHPGRYAATLRAVRAADDREAAAATEAVLATVLGLLGAMHLRGDDAIHAARALRAMLHGFVSLEQAGGFGLPQDVDASFAWAVDRLESGLQATASGTGLLATP